MIILEIISDKRRTILPLIAESGIKYLLSFLTINLVICGAISPIKPIIPTQDVISETINETMIIEITESFFKSTPLAFENSSPKSIALK
jgi:hypothetical protein